jgi:hypothetical protein
VGLLGPQYASSVHTVDSSGRVVGHAKYSGVGCIQLLELVKSLLTNRWSGRVIDKVPSSYACARAAQLKR